MTAPTPLREALATALHALRSKEHKAKYRYPRVCCGQHADAILAHPSMSPFTDPERAEHEAVGRAVARLPGHWDMERHPDGTVTVVGLAYPPERTYAGYGASLPEAIVAALGPSEGERTEAET